MNPLDFFPSVLQDSQGCILRNYAKKTAMQPLVASRVLLCRDPSFCHR